MLSTVWQYGKSVMQPELDNSHAALAAPGFLPLTRVQRGVDTSVYALRCGCRRIVKCRLEVDIALACRVSTHYRP